MANTDAPVHGRRRSPRAPQIVLEASQFASLVNGYSIGESPRTITVQNASQLAGLQDVTVSGMLLRKQTVELTPPSARSATVLGTGAYTVNSGDGDIHFCLGSKQLTPHIACELQRAAAWASFVNTGIGQTVTVSGFFRCMFEHPGFAPSDDAHIFEIHPVRSLAIGGHVQAFDVGVPDQKSIHTWISPHPLNDQDLRIKVEHDLAGDTLSFSGMDGQDENYVNVSGTISEITLATTSATPSQFTLTSSEVGRPLRALCLSGTAAASQLAQLSSKNVTDVTMIALRNIDLPQALKGKYVISLLAIDMRAGLNTTSLEWPPTPA